MIGARLKTGLGPASVKLCLPFVFARQDRIDMCDPTSLIELDQVLEDQLTPGITAPLH